MIEHKKNEIQKNEELRRSLLQGKKRVDTLQCFKNLAAAILYQSAADYNNPSFKNERYFIQRFSNTQWCEELCSLVNVEVAKYKNYFGQQAV